MSDNDEAPQNSGGTAALGPPIGRPFQPGQSGNPGGRPKGFAGFRARLLENEDVAFEMLMARVAQGDMDALKLFFSYAYGKPAREVILKGADGGPVKVTYDLKRLTKEELAEWHAMAKKAAAEQAATALVPSTEG